jgi:hypothetical protein
VRDPLIGRDILIGGVTAVVLGLLQGGQQLALEWIGTAPDQLITGSLALLEGTRPTLAQLVSAPGEAMLIPVFILFVLLLLRVLLRRQWAAVLGLVVLWLALVLPGSPRPAAALVFALPLMGVLVFVLVRYGLLALAAGVLFPNVVWGSVDLSGWYADRSLLLLLVTVALAGYGFYTSLAGRPLFRGKLLPE